MDGDCKTNLPNVWAVGDVVRGPMLAHKAEEEGVAVAERIAGQHGHVNFDTVPWVIYTSPEIAWVGKTEQQLRRKAASTRPAASLPGQRPRPRAGRHHRLRQGDRRCQDRRGPGVHIVGPMASELISEAVTIMEFRAPPKTSPASATHPTLSEAVKEAALAVDKRALNF